MTGLRNHLLHAPALASGDSSTVTSAFSSHRSRSGPIGRSWLERARQHRAVDAAGGGAGDDVDDDAQLDLAADLAQELEIDRFGVVFPLRRIGFLEEATLLRRRARSAIPCSALDARTSLRISLLMPCM